MKVKIKEIGKIENLNIYDTSTGVDWIQDLIGNAGALSDGQFEYDYDEDVYITDQETYDWWERYIDDNNKTEEDVELLANELDIDEDIIYSRIAENTGDDYNDHRNQAISVMDNIREEYKN